MSWKSIIILFFIIGCRPNLDKADGVLKNFIQRSFDGKLDKKEVMATATGRFKEGLLKFNDEEFKKFLDFRKYKKKKFKILHQQCNPQKCSITYLINYLEVDLKTKKNEVEAEVKKIAQMEKIEGAWKIAEIANIKTNFEAANPIEGK